MNRASPEPEPTSAEPSEPRSSALAGLVWFLVFTTVGVAALAAAVLLPEYAALAEVEARRDALAHQVELEKKLARYNQRLLRALERDPILTARLMTRYANYLPAGCREIAMDPSQVDDPLPTRIMQEATRPPPPRQDALVRAGRWLEHRPTRTGLILLGLGTLVLGMMPFIGRSRAGAAD